MSKLLLASTVISTISADLTWGTRCEYRAAGCTRGVASCSQFKLVNGCANDGTGFVIQDGLLSAEEGACDSDNVLTFTSGATTDAFGKCVTITGDSTTGTPNRYVKFYASDDEDASLRSYTLTDLENCENVLPASTTDLFLDSYTMHSDAYTCTTENTLNHYSYISKNNACDQNGVRPVLVDSSLTINSYNDAETCVAGVVDPVVSYYRVDGSCHIGKFQSVLVGLFHAHVGLCGEPAPRASVDTTPATCTTEN